MRRRKFITLLSGAVAAWPLAGRAQQPERVRHIGALLGWSADDPESLVIVGAFSQGLQEERIRQYAVDLVATAPDVLLASGNTIVRALQIATTTLPIVFVNVGDPVGSGLVASLAQPGGNATGFLNLEYGMSGKWLELLKQTAPRVRRVAVIRDPTARSGLGQFGAIMGAAPTFGIEVSPIDARDVRGMERTAIAFSQAPNGGLIMTTSRLARTHRDLIVTLAARHKLPAVYPNRNYVTARGLLSYGPDYIEQFRQAAVYVDRILKGEKPGDLPVQQPTKFELVINLKTAKALALSVPQTLQLAADEVIE